MLGIETAVGGDAERPFAFGFAVVVGWAVVAGPGMRGFVAGTVVEITDPAAAADGCGAERWARTATPTASAPLRARTQATAAVARRDDHGLQMRDMSRFLQSKDRRTSGP
jgi:hypothetical protein